MGVHRAARPGRTRWSAATALVLLALFAGAVGAAPALAATGTYVRLGQFTPGMPGNELVVFPVGEAGDEVRIPAVDYGGLSEYRRIEPGDYVVGIRPAGTDGPPVVTSTLDAMPGSAYTLAAVGPADAPVLTVVPDDLTPPPAGEARLRVFQAFSPDPVDVAGPGGLDLGRAVPVGAAGEYRSVPAGQVDLTVRGAVLPVTVGAGQVVSVVLVDRDGAPAAQVHVDAAGPVVVPPGPVDAGFGPGDGDRVTGVAVLGGFAAVAAATAAWLGRPPRAARRTC
ncbi:DUF4397 domain-containing protein [Pseudonocardia hydrocarbonoxydans]|uniref:DUF4397 domain-containing protein n=1 Tax=Pseudonocardia hydrocarbonoxydans TaxID=76726 RepID=A0A4Y3WNU8_9PSEU|nr:DUF4397 domain-containing protein [Pseudonocardia hydrocarbonoxydans]GEC20474.1 hypothetical protein PHY01_27570 [Pseudonocardia hydrocarbonoxydans]